VFGSLIASATPLLIAGIAIGGAFFAMWLVSLLTDVSIFGLNLITGLGTGLGIDYSLLIVNRFREELHAGASVDDAVSRTVHSAGRTVFFSGLTVAVTLGSLVIFPQYFLKTFGYAAITVVISAIVGALIPLPALLKILGHKVDKYVIRKSGITPKADGRWSAVARFVMARPKRVLVATLIIITVLIWPITSVKFSQVDERTLPKSDKAFISAQVQKERFNGNFSMPIEIVAPSSADLSEQLSKLASLPNIVMVTQPKVVGEYQKAQAISSIPARTPDGEAQIEKVRSQAWPTGTLIGGVAADYTDAQNGIKTHLPIVAVWVILAVLILLFLFTGSILLPIKAIILNAISLGAMIGILTWVFIDGNLSWLVGDFTNTGTIDTSMLVLIAVTTFGLSMDYELFLLSRIKEEHDAGRNTIDSVAFGLQKSARIITAAAMLLAVVFATFLISGVTMIKMLGFGVAFAILIDATIVRALLVPALMRLFGERNWWAPKSLKRLNILNH
jgi:RND superfamily putative drug exporter